MLPRPELSLSLAGLDRDADAPWADGARAAIAWAASLGLRAVQLDASSAPPHGVRARDLDRSARRDLAALLRRNQLMLSGVDLWIPSEHFIDPTRSDRAMEATLAAMELAAEVSLLVTGSPPPVLSLTLPELLGSGSRGALIARAEATGTRIADHTPVEREAVAGQGDAPLAIGVDPGALLLAGLDPVLAVSRAGGMLASARVSDAAASARAAPTTPGARLDLLAYLVALSTVSYTRPLILDLRGVPEQQTQAARISSEWLRPPPGLQPFSPRER